MYWRSLPGHRGLGVYPGFIVLASDSLFWRHAAVHPRLIQGHDGVTRFENDASVSLRVCESKFPLLIPSHFTVDKYREETK